MLGQKWPFPSPEHPTRTSEHPNECLEHLGHGVGSATMLQGLDIPTGFSASVILLNMYMFKPEFLFVEKLVLEHPELAAQTHVHELFYAVSIC